jgi:hypothetical protein
VTHVTIIDIRQTANGGLYVAAEFRLLPTDPTPYLIEDFTWSSIPRRRRPRRIDAHGRVRIGNKWIFPKEHDSDGNLVDVKDLHNADLEPWAFEETFDAMLDTMLRHAEGHKAGGMPTGDRRMPAPPGAAVPDAIMELVNANIPGQHEDTWAAVRKRRHGKVR